MATPYHSDQYDYDDLPPPYSELFPDSDEEGEGGDPGCREGVSPSVYQPGQGQSGAPDLPPPYTPGRGIWTQHPVPRPVLPPQPPARPDPQRQSIGSLVMLPKNHLCPLSLKSGPMTGHFSNMCVAVPEKRLLLRTYMIGPAKLYSFSEYDLNTLTSIRTYQKRAEGTSGRGGGDTAGRDRGDEAMCLDTKRGLYITTAPQEIMIITDNNWLMDRIGEEDDEIFKNVRLRSVAYNSNLDLIAVADIRQNQILFVNHIEKKVLLIFGSDFLLEPSSVQFVHSPRQTYLAISDTGNHCIQLCNMRGKLSKKFGTHGTDGAHLNKPYGVCVDPNGKIIVADRMNKRVVSYWRANGCDHCQCLLDSEDLGGEWPEHVDLCASLNTLIVITRNDSVTGNPHTVRTYQGLSEVFLTPEMASTLISPQPVTITHSITRSIPTATQHGATSSMPQASSVHDNAEQSPVPTAPPIDNNTTTEQTITERLPQMRLGPDASLAQATTLTSDTSPSQPRPTTTDMHKEVIPTNKLTSWMSFVPKGAYLSDMCVKDAEKQILLRVYKPNPPMIYAFSTYDLTTLQPIQDYDQKAVVPYKIGLAPEVQARLVAKTRALMDNGDEAICMDVNRGLVITIAPQHIMLINQDNQLVCKIGEEDDEIFTKVKLRSVTYNSKDDLVAVVDIRKNRVLFVNHIHRKVVLVFGADHLRQPTAARFFHSPRQTYIAVSDTGNHCIKICNMAGKLTKIYGEFGFLDRDLYQPQGVCVDPNGKIIVADRMNKRVVCYWRAQGQDQWRCLLDRYDLEDECPEHIDLCASANILVVVTRRNSAAGDPHTVRTFTGLAQVFKSHARLSNTGSLG